MGSDGEIISGVAAGEGVAAAENREAKDGNDHVGSGPPAPPQPVLSEREVAADDDAPATEKRGTPEMEDANGIESVALTEDTDGLPGAPGRRQKDSNTDSGPRSGA